ncbi:TPA: lipid II-degrading bacteriocin [Serratia fonticola]
MSDIMTVTATPLTPGNMTGLGVVVSSPNIPSNEQMVAMAVKPYFQSEAWTNAAFVSLISALANKDAKKIGSLLNFSAYGEKQVVWTGKLSNGVWRNYYDSTHYPYPFGQAPGQFDFKRDAVKEFTGGVVSPVAALAYYVLGNGEERMIKIENIGLKLKVSDIPPVMSVINSGQVGVFKISSNFTRDTSKDGMIPAAYLGNITLKTEGVLSIQKNGTWNYNGVIRAYNDTFDANPSSHRGALGESATTILRALNGKPYTISIPGELPAKYNGKR